ncbi:MAG: hypothetical protein ACRCXB_35025 [Aeromonadaceae bacterium]
MNEDNKTPFSNSYNLNMFFTALTYSFGCISVLVFYSKYLYSLGAALIIASLIISSKFKFLWHSVEWFKTYVLVISLGQIPFIIGSLIFDNEFIVFASFALTTYALFVHQKLINEAATDF